MRYVPKHSGQNFIFFLYFSQTKKFKFFLLCFTRRFAVDNDTCDDYRPKTDSVLPMPQHDDHLQKCTLPIV